MRWFAEHLPKSGVAVRPISTARLGLCARRAAGPASCWRGSPTRTSRPTALPFFGIRAMDVGCAPALVARVSFTGELGYEIYVEAVYALAVYDALVQAGEDLGLVHFGGRALNSLRLEKSFGAWLREYTPDYTPRQAGLDRFIDFEKGDFVGRDAALRQREREPSHRLVTLVVDAADADAVRRRAGARGRAGGRLRHLRRLRPYGRQEHRARLRRAGAGDGRRGARR